MPEQPERNDRLAGATFDRDERGQRGGGQPEREQNVGAGPQPDPPRLEDAKEQRRHAGGEQHHAGPVERVAPSFGGVGQGAGEQRDRHDAEGQVDVEHPAPGSEVGQHTAEQRAEQRRHAPHAGNVTLHARPLLQAEQLADDRHAERHERARAEALQHPEADQLRHVLREARQRGAHEKDAEPEQIDGAPTEQIGQTAPEGHRDRGGQQESREDPGVDVHAAEALHDFGHGRGDHRGFHRRQEHREHDAVERPALARVICHRLASSVEPLRLAALRINARPCRLRNDTARATRRMDRRSRAHRTRSRRARHPCGGYPAATS